MMTNLKLAALDWESGLKPGDEVLARWTNNFCNWAVNAVVVRVNRASIRVSLAREVVVEGKTVYPLGHEIVLPRIGARTHSVNNTAAPRVSL